MSQRGYPKKHPRQGGPGEKLCPEKRSSELSESERDLNRRLRLEFLEAPIHKARPQNGFFCYCFIVASFSASVHFLNFFLSVPELF